MRVLYSGYSGPLYQVCKGSFTTGKDSCTSGVVKNIGSIGGYADSASQDAFCPTGAICTISIIYDQSPNKNDLRPAPGGTQGPPDNPANAADLKTTVNGHSVYGILIKPGMGYRSGCTGCQTPTATGTATGSQPETEYMVTSKNNLVDDCCFDYGNAETSCTDEHAGTMEAVYFGGGANWGTGAESTSTVARDPKRALEGPWVMADLEDGLFPGWDLTQTPPSFFRIPTNTALKFDFVTALIVGDTIDKNMGMGRFAVYGGNAQSGALKTMYDGIRPNNNSGYNYKAAGTTGAKKGSIILGIGGDNSKRDGGEWFEGVMASGAATQASLDALQANIVAAKYGQ